MLDSKTYPFPVRYFPLTGRLQRTCFLLGGSAVDDGDVLEDSSTRTTMTHYQSLVEPT